MARRSTSFNAELCKIVVWIVRRGLGAGTDNLFHTELDSCRFRHATCGAQDRLHQEPCPNKSAETSGSQADCRGALTNAQLRLAKDRLFGARAARGAAALPRE